MRKTVAIILAVLMVISNLTCAFTVSAATTSDSIGEYFENPDNWMIYNHPLNSLSDGTRLEKVSGAWPDIQNKDNYVLEGDKSLYFRTRTKHSAVYLPSGLKANTEYTLSFSYYTAALYGTDVTAFNPISFFTTDVENAGCAYGKPGVLYFKANNVSYTSTDGLAKENVVYAASGENLLATTAGEWHKVEIKFNTGSFKEFALEFRSSVEYLYLDDFAITEKVITADEYFKNPDNWTIYNSSAKSLSDTSLILENMGGDNWPGIVNSSTYVKNALRLRTKTKNAAVYLPSGLKANTEYILSFSYFYNTAADATAFNPISLCTTDVENAGFAYDKPGVLYFKSNNVVYTSSNGLQRDSTTYAASGENLLATTAGEWHKVEIKFNTAEFKEFALVFISTTEYLQLNDFSLTEKIVTPEEYFNNPKNWKLDYETATTIGSVPASSWAYITNSKVTVGSDTVDALKLYTKNHRASVHLPNLKKNTEYLYSFKYYSPNVENSEFIFEDMVLLNTEFENAKIVWNYETPNGVKEFVSRNGYYIWNTDYSKATTSWDVSKSTKAIKNGAWNTYSVIFNTGDYENYAHVLRAEVDNIFLCDFKLMDTSEIPEEVVELNFEDASQWERYSSSAINTSSGQAQNTWHVVSANTTETDFIKEGDSSIKITPQSQFNMIKLGGLEPNTKYMLKFSYITDSMKNTEGATKKLFFQVAVYGIISIRMLNLQYIT